MPFQLLDPTVAAPAPVITIGAPLTNTGETLSSIRAELLLEISSRTDVDLPRLNKWINWAYLSFAGMLKVAELKGSFALNTLASQSFYLLPSQVRSVLGVSVVDQSQFYSGGLKLLLSNEEEYRRQADSTAVYDRGPRNYFKYRNMLVLYPQPIDVQQLNVECWIRPDPLVNDDDSPILAVELHEPLLLLAKAKTFRSVRNYQEANLAQNDFLTAVRPLIDNDGEEAAQGPLGLTVARRASDLYRTRR